MGAGGAHLETRRSRGAPPGRPPEGGGGVPRGGCVLARALAPPGRRRGTDSFGCSPGPGAPAPQTWRSGPRGRAHDAGRSGPPAAARTPGPPEGPSAPRPSLALPGPTSASHSALPGGARWLQQQSWGEDGGADPGMWGSVLHACQGAAGGGEEARRPHSARAVNWAGPHLLSFYLNDAV